MNPSAPVSEPIVFTPELLWERALEQLYDIDDRLAQANILAQANGLASDGYNIDNRFKSRVCGGWSALACKLVRAEVGLFDRSATVEIREWEPPIPIRVSPTVPPFHRFVQVCLRGLEPRLIDGTWQQLLHEDQRHPDLPRVLSGNYEQATEAARTAGVRDPLIRIWRDAVRCRFQV